MLKLKLALRFVRSRRKGALTRFISFASTCGIAIGVFAAIVGFSAMNGFEYELEHRVLSIIPSAQLNSSEPYFSDPDDLQHVLSLGSGIVATSPAIDQRAIVSANRAFAPLMISGIQSAQEKKVIAIQRFVSIDLDCLNGKLHPALSGKCDLGSSKNRTSWVNQHIELDDSADNILGYATETDQGKVLASLRAQAKETEVALEEHSGTHLQAGTSATGQLNAGAGIGVGNAISGVVQSETELAEITLEEIAAARAHSSGSVAYSPEANPFSTGMGSSQDSSTLPRIILGSGIAKKLEVGVGDEINVVTLDNTALEQNETMKAGSIKRSLKTPQRHKAVVIGIIHIGGQLDSAISLMNFDDLKTIANLQGPNSIHIRTSDQQSTNQIVFAATSGKIKENAYLVTWMSSQGKLYHDIQMIRQIMFISMFLVLAVACFNIISNLMMLVGEKRREIAILLTMGMKPRHVITTFSLMALISGGYGAFIGLVLGVATSLTLTPLTLSFKDWFGFDLLNEEVYFINFIPCRLEVMDVVLVLTISLVMSWLAALYPAFRAARIAPAKELNL